MRPVAIIDIDTTIANNEHRATVLNRACVSCAAPMKGERGAESWPVCDCGSTEYKTSQAAWDSFLAPELVLQDTIQPHAADVLEHMRKTGWSLVFLTGRNEGLRQVTEEWLRTHAGMRNYEPLVMRPLSMKNVSASDCKEAIFLDFVSRYFGPSHYQSFVFFEDDRFVLNVWKKYGVVFKSPEIWAHMDPVTFEPKHEPVWNR